MTTIHQRIAELEAQRAPAAVVTVVRVSGSTPRAPGSKMIVHPDGQIEGTIGGGRVEQSAIEAGRACIDDQRTRFLEYALTQDLGMCCGGQIALFVEPLVVAPRLLIFGAGHVGAALCQIASHAGFVVHVADDREQWLRPERLAVARQLHEDTTDPTLPWGDDCYVMITTHDHALDQRLLERALAQQTRWVGVIGSRRKAELTRQRLAHKGFSDADIARVRIPVGLAIRAETPEEIAVSILGELIALRRKATDLDLETKTR